MRLHLFLPHRRPSERGRVRRALAALGPTWAASPVRRIIQTACLALFVFFLFVVCWQGDARHMAEAFAGKEVVDAESFLLLDPLVAASSALASREWTRPLAWAAALVAVCLVIPRGFCAFVCPLGAMIDLFDWVAGKRVGRLKIARRGWWVHLKYCLLIAAAAAALCGAGLAGYVAAIPVATRGLAFGLGPVQVGLAKGWSVVPALHAGHWLGIGLFLGILGLGFMRPRFWCCYVCPTGAVFSLTSRLRLCERKVGAACIECGKCVAACPFEAIREDFTTRPADCTFCQTCAGVCPARAIAFGGRWEPRGPSRAAGAGARVRLSRRGLLLGLASGAATAAGLRRLTLGGGSALVRPPGSAPEEAFLRLCVRCGACIKACPTGVLQPVSVDHSPVPLWTPHADTDWSGCEPTCNICGQVCPTGAIRALPLAEKRAARMGRAVVDERTCLPHAGKAECRLCVDQCAAAGYHAIEFLRVRVEMDENGMPDENSGWLAPAVQADKCVGCGLCQARCYNVNVKAKAALAHAAIRVAAGEGCDDRLRQGSYVDLRKQERMRHEAEQRKREKKLSGGESYLPDFLKGL